MKNIKAALWHYQSPVFTVFCKPSLCPVFIAYPSGDIELVVENYHTVNGPIPVVTKSIFIDAHPDFIIISHFHGTSVVFKGWKGIGVVDAVADGKFRAGLAGQLIVLDSKGIRGVADDIELSEYTAARSYLKHSACPLVRLPAFARIDYLG